MFEQLVLLEVGMFGIFDARNWVMCIPTTAASGKASHAYCRVNINIYPESNMASWEIPYQWRILLGTYPLVN